MKIRQANKQTFGFTLIEIMIAVFIFALLSTVVAGIYVAFSQSQTRSQASQKLLSETQFSLDSLAREIRNGQIDYSNVCANFGQTFGQDCLSLINSNGFPIVFLFDGTSSLKHYVHDGTTWQPGGAILPVDGTVLEQINFSIDPVTDPFLDDGPNRIPFVTIEAKIKVDTTRNIEKVTYNLQTSASSRVFPQ